MAAYLLFFLALTVLANVPRLSTGLRDFAVLLVSFFFVGFRFEMAYDWPYYKDMFQYLSGYGFSGFLQNYLSIQIQYPSEVGFLFLAHAFSQFVPEYEWFQAFIYLVFLASFWSLGKSIRCQNIGAALIVVHLFLLFTLEFSTIRQAFAISLFNLGLAAYLANRKTQSILLIGSSIFFQVSALIYIGALVLAAINSRKMWVTAAMVLLLSIPLVFPSLLIDLFSVFPSRAAEKLMFYFTERQIQLNWAEVAFALVFYSLIALMSFRIARISKHIDEPKLILLLKFNLILAIFALLFILEHVIRNRIFYQLVIVFSLLAFSRYPVARTRFLWPVVAMGIVFTLVSFSRPSSFMYVPYQNYIVNSVRGWGGDGEERNQRYWQLLEESR